MVKREKHKRMQTNNYSDSTFYFSEDGVPTIYLGQSIQIFTESARDYYGKMIKKNLDTKSEKFRVVFEFTSKTY